MDSLRGFDDEDRTEVEDDAGHAGVAEAELAIGTDERRMHVRAYNYWVSLLRGRAFPAIEDLDPDNIADFGPNSVLLDFTRGLDDPAIAYLGRELRDECGVAADVTRVAEVPSRSLLSRLTDHYLQIIANRAPIGFEAEFVGTRGHNTLYRGILMPFTSDGNEIDFIYGVINWKELVDATTQSRLDAEVAAALKASPRHEPATVWADGPSAGFEAADEAEDAEDAPAEDALPPQGELADQLMLARETAAAARAADTRSRAALYRALGRAHDFALGTEQDPAGYAELLEDAGLTVQARAPMTPVVKLVFGADYDKTRLTEFAAVLSAARREGVPAGGLVQHLDGLRGGIKAMVAAERIAKRPPVAAVAPDRADALRRKPAIASIALPIDAPEGAFVVLLARAGAGGMLDIVGIANNARLTEQAIRATA